VVVLFLGMVCLVSCCLVVVRVVVGCVLLMMVCISICCMFVLIIVC